MFAQITTGTGPLRAHLTGYFFQGQIPSAYAGTLSLSLGALTLYSHIYGNTASRPNYNFSTSLRFGRATLHANYQPLFEQGNFVFRYQLGSRSYLSVNGFLSRGQDLRGALELFFELPVRLTRKIKTKAPRKAESLKEVIIK